MKIKTIIKKLDKHHSKWAEKGHDYTKAEIDFYTNRDGSYATVMFVPQEENYNEMLKKLKSTDIVCDMGAGDLRFALMASEKVKKIYAVEMCPLTIGDAIKIIGYYMPRNLIPICADWRFLPIPDDVTIITCMVNGARIPKEWIKNGIRVYHGIVTTKGDKIEQMS